MSDTKVDTGTERVWSVVGDIRAAMYDTDTHRELIRNPSLMEIADLLESLAAERDEYKRYRDALEQAAICDMIGTDWDDPMKLLAHIVKWNVFVSLDPSVSEDARTLRDTYKTERDTLRTQLATIKPLLHGARVKCEDGDARKALALIDEALGEIEVEG